MRDAHPAQLDVVKPRRERAAAAGGLRRWVAREKVFVGSAAMTALSAFTYTNLNFSLPQFRLMN
jgi:hypothetical protein